METLSLTSKHPEGTFKPSLKKPFLFLSHVLATMIVLFLVLLVFQLFSTSQSFPSLMSFLLSLPISKLISGVILFLTVSYGVLLLSGKNVRLQKSYLRESLFAFVLLLILYVYGEQDRFLLSDNPGEDLADFSFILFLVVSFWALISMVFNLFRINFGKLNRFPFLLFRGVALLLMIIPLDILFNYFYLKLTYGLPLYEDYWVLEIPLKITILLLVNFLDEVIRLSRTSVQQPTSIKVKSGNRYRFISSDSIAYFIVQNQISYLHTIQGEKFIIDQPLKTLEKTLNSGEFFRAGRQLLVSRKSIKGYKTVDGKKIELELSSSQGLIDKYLISRLNAPDFRRWVNTEAGTIQV